MNYSKAVCKELSNEMKSWFFSSNIEDLIKAQEICRNCVVKEDCYKLGTSLWNNCGVWGGKILNRGEPISERYIKTAIKLNRSIKFQWY